MTIHKRLTRRATAWLSILLLLVGLLPLYALALYNHAFYDDFGFSLLTRDAWQTTHSIFGVVEAAVRNTVGIRQTWEGTYTTSFLSTFQPALFGEGAYWVTTFLLLTVFMLSVWFFLKQSLGGVYGMDRTAVFTAFGVLGFVLVQFVPDAAEAFFWFNGGVAYTLLWSVLLFAAGVWLKLERARGGWRCTLLTLLLAVLMVLLGGAKYSTVLFAALLALSATAWAFFKRRPKRWIDLLLTALLLAGFAFSMAAPGNAVRAKTLSGGMSAPKAVLEAVYFGLALLGHSFSLPLLAAMVLLVPLSIPALRRSGFAFGHPVWVTLLCVTLFCAQLAPTLYTGNYLGDGRVLNTYHYALVLMLAQVVLYWTGYFVRRTERGLSPVVGYDPFGLETPPLPTVADSGALLTEGQTLPAAPEAPSPAASTRLEEGLKAATLALVAGLLLVGCIAYHPDGAASYGPQNMAGGSALRAVLDGQAAAYDAAMDARDATLNDSALQDVVLTPVPDAPAVFMGDALHSDNLEYVLNLYADYYDKATVRVADTGD
ncbi:MAG: hypothetical protein VB104_06545 [Candidatus Limiplasma sp.]|nr:hypothetical protein [Candidatus Limiplasma sp.]